MSAKTPASRWMQTVAQSADDGAVRQAAWCLGRRRVTAARPRLWARAVSAAPTPLATRCACLEAWLDLADPALPISAIDWPALEAADPGLVACAVAHPCWFIHPERLDRLPDHAFIQPSAERSLWRCYGAANRPVPFVPVPPDLWERTGIPPDTAIDWAASWNRAVPTTGSGARRWVEHAEQWASTWFRLDAASHVYHYRREQENRLRQWLGQAPDPVPALPAEPKWAPVPADEPSFTALARLVLGLFPLSRHYPLPDFSARWDGIWASWASGMRYELYERTTDTQITNWHIAALTGQLLSKMPPQP